MTQKQYREWYFRKHNQYERKAFNIIKNEFKKALSKINTDNLTKDNYQALLNINITNEMVFKTIYKIHLEIGLEQGNRIIKSIQKEKIQTKNSPLFNRIFQESLIAFLRLNEGGNIVSIRQTLISAVIDFISSKLDENKTLSEIVTCMLKSFGTKTGLYRWQMIRIARTETTTSANHAAYLALDTNDFVVDKIWISTLDKRTRNAEDTFDHLAMNGVTIGFNEYFEVPSIDGTTQQLLYPGDPKGSAGNIINCRCTIAPKPKRDKNGKLILKM